MTTEQAEAVARLLVNWDKVRCITLHHNPFELPVGYVAFTLEQEESGYELFGGISPEGEVST